MNKLHSAWFITFAPENKERNEAGDSGKSYMVDKLASFFELSCKYELFSIRFRRGVGIEGSFGDPSWSA